MESSFKEDVGVLKVIQKARDLFDKGNYIKSLELIEDLILVHREDKNAPFLHVLQGKTFYKLAEENPECFVYLLASLECFSYDVKSSKSCAFLFYKLAKKVGLILYYKKCVEKAKQALSFTNSVAAQISLQEKKRDDKKDLETLIKQAEFMIAASKKSPLENCEPKVRESKKSPDPSKDEFKGLRSYWLGLDVKLKRDFMKVSIEKLVSFLQGVHKTKGRVALEEVLASAKEDRKWTFWMCRTKCFKKFSSAEECKDHLERQHAADFKPSSGKNMVRRIGKDWARKISIGSWEPVDAVAAVEMIKNQLADVKAFASKSKNGWSKEWPLAVDEERGKLLKEIKLLLVLFCDHKILPCSIRDWLMRFPVKHLAKLEVSEQSLIDSRLVETPQSICFLECHELNQILEFLKNIKCERNDGTDLVCRAVDSKLDSTRVKEKIDFDPQFSFLLLDRRLLKSNNVSVDDEGTINVFDPNVHYAKAHAQGDDFISWLTDYTSVDKTFPRPIREHNLDLWIAILRAVQFTCRTLGTKYAKKVQVLDYAAALTVIENLCINEDERRRNLQEDQWNRYASLICDRCKERVPGNSLSTKLFLCVVRDVFEGALHPTFDFPDLEDCLNLIRERESLSDDKVLKSIDVLKSLVIHKVLLIDSKILLIDNSRISLLNNLTRLSVFDNRTYILQLLKPFLLIDMESKAKSDAAEKKKSRSKKNKNKTKKQRSSTSMSSLLDKTVEHTSPVEEDSMEPEETLGNEEATKNDPDMQNMPGEDSLSEHLESALGEAAARYNSALDMTLKALLNIKVLKDDLMKNKQSFQHHLEAQVPSALQNLFTAFVSEVIKNEGVYSWLLSDLLASLEQVPSVVGLEKLSDAAEVVVVAILELWHFWKSRERESLVTRLFTVEEKERMSCVKCRRKPNYPEQSSYGIVMAADSIRDLKRALGSIKFVDILKVIRMEYQMSCDIKTGGCGKTNFVHHTINRCPPIFTIVLEWEKSETENEISETTKALEWEIDISRLYKGLEANTKYRLVSMVGCSKEEEAHICIAYERDRWVNLRRESLVGENVVRFCGERKIRPEIMFYEAVRSM